MKRQNIFFYIFLFVITVVSFYYRFKGLVASHPFWVDEFSTANQARLVLQYGLNVLRNSTIHFEPHNLLFHFIIALFYRWFGQSEFITRLPSVIIGSFIPILLIILGRKIFNLTTGVVAGLFATTSYFLITWSRQARSYVFLQFFILLTTYFYIKVTQYNQKTRLNKFLLLLFIAIGLLTHAFFYIFLVSLALHYVVTNRKYLSQWLKSPIFYIVVIAAFFISYSSGFLSVFYKAYIIEGIVKSNNFRYYHSFLWREYGLITYLSFLGLFFAFEKHKKIFLLFVLYLLTHLIFIIFFFAPYVSRYLLPVWPFILLMAAYALSNIADIMSQRFKRFPNIVIAVMLTLAIILNGHKFVIKPRSFYSVNHDFREIALIDYGQIYGIIKKKGDLDHGKTAVIDTWYDRLYWYLGQDFPQAYLFRWINEKGTTNGLFKKTVFAYNNKGEKVVPGAKNLGFIGELYDLKLAMKKYPKGFIIIDDSSLPKDVIDFAQKHLKKELYLDHYPLDDNPYSLWPATLYSWGL